MTRNRIAGAAAAVALLAVPAVASAHGAGHDDHGRHHGRHHRHHVKPAPVKQVAGTVTAFTDGQLTITLTNGKSYDGQVTDRTALVCHSATAPVPTARKARHGHDDPAPAPSSTTPSSTTPSTTTPGTTPAPVPATPPVPAGKVACTTADLVAGAKVTEAKLTLKGDGSTWKKVELLK